MKAAIANTGWLFFDKLVRMSVGLFISVWLARYLGPSDFGSLNYAIAIVGLWASLVTLGLNGVVVRDLVADPGSHNVTLGTAFFLQLLAGFAALLLAIGTAFLLNQSQQEIQLLIAILSLTLPLKAAEVVKYWYESQVRSKYIVIVGLAVFLLGAAARVILILLKAPISAFVVVITIEAIILALGLMAVYAQDGNFITKWGVTTRRARELIAQGWPFAISTIAIVVYMRIDQIMLGYFGGGEIVGYYSAALQISEAWYFIPMAIVASWYPVILKYKYTDECTYHQKAQTLYRYLVCIGLILAVTMTFCSSWVITSIYGERYALAANVLTIHIWTGVFVSLGVASGSWLVAEGLYKHALYRTLAGALVNVIANFWMIPHWGAEGAAWATLISQGVAAYLYDACTISTRDSFIMKTRALLYPLLWLWKAK